MKTTGEILTCKTKKFTMKYIATVAVLAIFTSAFFIPAGYDLSKKDRANAVAYFTETRQLLQKEIAGLSENQLNWKPADSVWSIANCVEHIAITEKGIFDWAMSTVTAKPDSSIDVSKKISDDEIKTKITDRSAKGKAPEIFRPSGRFGNTAQSFAVFSAKRDSLIHYMKTTKDDLRAHHSNTFLGVVDSYQLLLLLSAHTRRHTLQITELKALPGFPAK